MDKRWVAKAFADYGDLVYRIACARLGQRQDAEDITQETFIRLLHSGDPCRSQSELKAWLIRVALNLCIDQRRSAWFRYRASDEELTRLPAETVDTSLSSEMETALGKLSADERTILYLHYYEGYKIGEIAPLLGLKVSTCSSRLRRARSKLAPWLEESQ